MVVHTDHLDKRKLKGLDAALKKTRTTLQKKAAKLMKLDFACWQDAEAAFSAFLKEEKNDFYPLNGMVEEAVVTAKRTRRGRPRKDEQPVTRRVYRVCLQIGEPYWTMRPTSKQKEWPSVLS